MDQSSQIKALFAIVQQQQKIIEKLAQVSGQQLPPQNFQAAKPELHPEVAVLNALKAKFPAVAMALRPVMPIVPKGTNLLLFFQPGKASQQAVDSVVKVVQELVSKNALPFPYTVEAAV